MSYSSGRQYWLDMTRLRGHSHSQRWLSRGRSPQGWRRRSPNRAQSLLEAGRTGFVSLFVCGTNS